MELGLRDYSVADLEAVRSRGEVLHVKVVGLARIASDVTAELALATIGSITVLGSLQASGDIKTALAARINQGAPHRFVPPRERLGGTAPRTIVLHGTADTTVHPSNGYHIARHALDRSSYQTIETVKQGETAGRNSTRTVTTTSSGALVLEHWSVESLGQAWSGGQPPGFYADQTGLDASAEMIRCFFNTTDVKNAKSNAKD